VCFSEHLFADNRIKRSGVLEKPGAVRDLNFMRQKPANALPDRSFT